MPHIWIYLQNGTFIQADSFGSCGTITGELIFNTSMTGYQEIITDPSYAGQFILFTSPEIGVTGINDNDMQSDFVHTHGMIVRNYTENYSNYRSQNSLSSILIKNNKIGICNIDTRFITKMIRESGSMKMVASTEISDKNELKKILEQSPKIEDINYIQKISTKEPYEYNLGSWNHTKQKYNEPKKENRKKITVIDFGVKKNILNELVEAGGEIRVVPHSFDENDIIEEFKNKKLDGLFLSNGPGDPLILKKETTKIKKLIDANIPIFGICFGHQMLSIANGYDTYKLQFGHHGGNHPAYNHESKKVEITAQNHNYNVPKEIENIAHITHTNLFDNTIEGVEYKNKKVFSVQFHPESSPGPHESKSIFKKFIDML
jgi:carbamoyl-phosphate synthase small subunit